MVAQLTASESDLVVQRNHLAQAMVSAVARTGSGLYLQQVHDFQQGWNSYLPITVKQAQIAGMSSAGITALKAMKLVVDGQYGPHTATALGIIVGPPLPPSRASGMTTWYAQNNTRVDALAPMNVVPVDQIITPPQPNISSDSGVASMTASVQSGSTVQTVVQSATSPAATGQQPMAQSPVLVQPDTSGVVAPAAISTSKVTVVDMTGPGEDVPIVATPKKGGVPLLAIVAGGAALAGVLYMFTRKGGGRRARFA